MIPQAKPEYDRDHATFAPVTVEKAIRQRLVGPYAFYFKDVGFDFDAGVLTLRGRVPTFRLKTVLPSLVSDVEGVKQIDDQVEVVSNTGLSTVRPNRI